MTWPIFNSSFLKEEVQTNLVSFSKVDYFIIFLQDTTQTFLTPTVADQDKEASEVNSSKWRLVDSTQKTDRLVFVDSSFIILGQFDHFLLIWGWLFSKTSVS